MDFQPLPPNPKPKHILENPFLLEIMEDNQFIHSKSSHFRVIPPRLQTLINNKRPKRTFKSPSIPFYQSSKYQLPNINSPRPRKPYWPKVYTRKQASQSSSNNIPKQLPPPQLINISDTKKFIAMVKNVQPGININMVGAVESVIKKANWEGLVGHLGKRFYPHLMGEFYCNMRVTKGIDSVLPFTTSVNRKTILIDHKTINMALHLPIKLTDHEHPCLDIYSYFVFNKEEFQLMLSNFCDSDVPLGLCDKPCSIHYKHFNPMFQQLALIIRANVLPKPNQSKFFDFYDMKVMFLLYNNKINFNISYVILLNLINANLVEYMPYGLMITSILNLCHVSTPFDQATIADSCLTPAHTRNQVSLTLCEPQNVFLVKLPQNIREEDVYLSNNEYFKMLFEEQIKERT